jgi:hypothetical protein
MKNLANVKNVEMSSCKVPVIFVRFYRNTNFLDRFSKKSQISSFIKILPVGAELFHADMMKLIVAFRSFANTPKNEKAWFMSSEHHNRRKESWCES